MVEKWVSIKEEKPKKMGQYIVMLEGGSIPAALWYAPMMDFWFETAMEFSKRKHIYNVTHWMHMPEPPRGE